MRSRLRRSDDGHWGLRRRIGRTSAQDKHGAARKRVSRMHGVHPRPRCRLITKKGNYTPGIGLAPSSWPVVDAP